MTILPLAVALERAMPFFLFALYLITSVRICRYAVWRDAGAPNPFAPRPLKIVVDEFQKRHRDERIN